MHQKKQIRIPEFTRIKVGRRYFSKRTLRVLESILLLIALLFSVVVANTMSGKSYPVFHIALVYVMYLISFFVFQINYIYHIVFKLFIATGVAFLSVLILNYAYEIITGNMMVSISWLLIFSVFSFCLLLVFYTLIRFENKEPLKPVNRVNAITVEDLLERNLTHTPDKSIHDSLSGKSVLITGGAGSIGSELVKQIATCHPKQLVVLDIAETPLYEQELALKDEFPDIEFTVVLANVSNNSRIGSIFSTYSFDIVFHAAAYKHVPLVENNPQEAVCVNVLGTVNVVRQSIAHGVKKFIMISTDKAVNPVGVMGASKRVAEMYIQALEQTKNMQTRFVITRFGNVLGSNGSVFSLFKQQIERGGPVTVTHPEATRYCMTISEACQLVLKAQTMGEGGEIYVFDMGQPIKILDLAEKMIRMAGYVPYDDMPIKITHLRSGEKLHEQLLHDASMCKATPHEKILIADEPVCNFEIISQQVNELIRISHREQNIFVVKKLREIVSQNHRRTSHA